MTYLIVLIVMLAAFTLVGWPLLTPSRGGASFVPWRSRPWEGLLSQRDSAYRALQDLEFEYQLGNLSQEDYQELRRQYRTQAAAILQRLDSLSQTEGASTQALAGEAAAAREATALSCPSCRQRVQAEDRYCWSCGTLLQRACPGCGALRPAGDAFCARCGVRLEGGEGTPATGRTAARRRRREVKGDG